MADLADLGMRFHTEGGEQAVRTLDQVAEKAGKAERATDALAGASKRQSTATSQMMGEILRAVQAVEQAVKAQTQFTMGLAEGALQALREADSVGKANTATRAYTQTVHQQAAAAEVAATAQNALVVAQGRSMTVSKQTGAAMLNLSRQMTDVGVTLAMGMNPLMVFIQQGPQIADAFAMASAGGMGFTATLRAMAAAAWAAVAPFAPFIAGAAAVAAVLGGALLLGTRELNKENKNLADTLGLTEKQLERVKDKGVTMGDTLKATFQVLGGYIWDAIGPQVEKVGAFVSDVLDKIGQAMKWSAGAYLGAWMATYNGITALWGNLPATVGDVAISAANLVLRATEGLLNSIIGRINQVAAFANAAASKMGMGTPFGRLGQASLGQIGNPWSGAARATGQEIAAGVGQSFRDGQALVTKVLGDIGARAVKNATDRIKKEAGEAGKATGKALKDGVKAELAANDNEWTPAMRELLADWMKQFDTRGMFRVGDLKIEVPVAPKLDTTAVRGFTGEIRRSVDQIQTEMARAADVIGSVGYAVDQVYYSLRNNDWTAAASGIIRAFQAIRDAQTLTGPNGQKAGWIGAAGATASAAGSAIGGVGGSTLAGAGSGALAGFTVAGPIGAAVGAVIGGITGFLGGSAAKKAQKQAELQRQIDAARQKAEEELARATKALNEQTSLQAQIAGFLGKAEEALNITREQALKQLEPENRALQQYAWALQDVQDRRSMEIDLLRALGRETEATAAARALELSQTRESLRALKQAIWDVSDARDALNTANDNVTKARQDLTEAYSRESSALKDTITRFGDFAKSLREFREGLSASEGALSGRYNAARATFNDVASRARLGDPEAMGRLTSVSQQFLDVSKSSAKTALDYARDVAAVKRATQQAEETATRQVDVATAQLNALDASVAGLGVLNQSTLSVRDAINNLAGAVGAQAAAQQAYNATIQTATQTLVNSQQTQAPSGPAPASNSGVPNYVAYVAQNPDLAAEYARIAGPGLASLGITDTASYGQWHYQNYGQGEGRALPTFANGGDHYGGLRMVGEQGPEIEATGPARYWNADQTRDFLRGGNDNGELITAINRLDQRLASIEGHTAKGARGSVDTADLINRLSDDGRSLNTKAVG